jgi:hypothetical protein
MDVRNKREGKTRETAVAASRQDFSVRGFMLDVSRGKVPTRRQLAELVDLLARLGYNHLQLYVEHTFAFSGHGRVWRGASPLKARDVRWLEALCHERGIELTANFNSFGHFERWLKHAHYKHLAECPDGFEHPIKGRGPHGTTLKPNAASLKFLDKLWAEYLPLFKSKRFNLGGDEPWELGLGWSKPLVKKYGKHRVYLNFLKKLYQQAKKQGKEILFWGDILLESPELVKEVPKDATALLWGYEAKHPFAKQAAKLAAARRKFWICPGTSAWNSFLGRTDNMLANIESAVNHGRRNGAEGFLLTSWGDGGNHQPWPVMYAGLVYASALAWKGKRMPREKLAKAISDAVFCGQDRIMAKLLIEAGTAERPLGAELHNTTRLHRWFFAPTAQVQAEAAKIPKDRLDAVAVKLRKLARQLGRLRTTSAEGARVQAELKLGVDMAAWAARRAQLLCAGRSTQPMAKALDQLIVRFKKVWRLRAESGGLTEAVARMRAVEQEL